MHRNLLSKQYFVHGTSDSKPVSAGRLLLLPLQLRLGCCNVDCIRLQIKYNITIVFFCIPVSLINAADNVQVQALGGEAAPADYRHRWQAGVRCSRQFRRQVSPWTSRHLATFVLRSWPGGGSWGGRSSTGGPRTGGSAAPSPASARVARSRTWLLRAVPG